MKIISFAWTTAAFKAKRKYVTRRDWLPQYAKQFKIGDVCQAYDKQARFGGVKIGLIKILDKYKEDISKMPEEDFEKEGFAYMEENSIPIWDKPPRQAFEDWKKEGGTYWVIRFDILELT